MSKIKIPAFLILASFVFITYSCYNDNKEDLYSMFNSSVCDTSNVTYANNLKHIFDLNCVNCHNGSRSDCNLNTFTNAHSYAILPNTNLYTKVKDGNHNNQILTDCEKNQLRIWIATGAN